MPNSSHLLAFVIASILLIQVPGPSLLVTIGRALTVGRREALLSVVGNALGLAAQVTGVTLGLGAVVAASATAFMILKFAGATYVIYLGVQAIRHRRDAREAMAAGNPVTRARGPIRTGFIVGVTNPKTIIFFAAFLPQFVNPHAAATPQLLALGVLFSVMAVASDSVWVAVASRARDWFARKPNRLDHLSAAGGVMMVGLGVTLASTN
ncbi:MAG: LysE family translocator [Marmoricola sp.]